MTLHFFDQSRVFIDLELPRVRVERLGRGQRCDGEESPHMIEVGVRQQRAIERGCDTFYLSTFSFQARPFYERLGYSVQLEIPGHGVAGSKFFMVRKLPG